jgi:tRNA C32,U32 (ribose-2'-O)-methylase TrmJ
LKDLLERKASLKREKDSRMNLATKKMSPALRISIEKLKTTKRELRNFQGLLRRTSRRN